MTYTPDELITRVLDDYDGQTPYDRRLLRLAVEPFVTWGVEVAAIEPELATLFTHRNIERFIQSADVRYTGASRGNRRTRLKRIVELVQDPDGRAPVLQPISGSTPSRPYTDHEIISMRSWANSMSTDFGRTSANVLLALGLGAGLGGREIARIRHGDITVVDGVTYVRVTTERVRTVPVLDIWAPNLAHAPAADPDSFIFRPTRSGEPRWVVANFVGWGERGPKVRPNTLRMRNTWLVRHLDAGTHPLLLAEHAGFNGFWSFTRLIPYLTVPDTATSIAQLTRPEGEPR